MITPQKRHRERAAEARAFFMRTNPSLQHWLETGEWLPSTEPPYFADEEQQHDRFAQALAQRDARIAELERALAALKPPGTVAVELGEWSVRIASFGLHEHPVLCREDLDDTEQDLFMHRAADIAARHHLDESKRYTATLLLTPVKP